jgi:competence protein ComEC
LNYEIKILKYVKKIFYIAVTIGFSVMFLIDLIPNNFIQLNAIDVGQGDSFLLTTTRQKQILIDGGGSENGNYDVGENVLLPYMLDRGITTIDYIFLSHAHADHIEGIYTLIKNIKVKQIFITSHSANNTYMSHLKSLCAKYKVPIKEIYKGDKLNIDGIYFEVLYPSRVDIDSNENNLSMLLKVIANNTTLLFTGDLEKEVEEKILDMNINADILKVSHHGSKTSTTKKFLDRVNPRISIISVAEDNSFGHPNQDVVESLLDTSKVYMTKDLGEIRFQIYKNGIIKFDSQLKNETP